MELTEQQRADIKHLLTNLSGSFYDAGYLAGMKDLGDAVGIDMNEIVEEVADQYYREMEEIV
ncbi:hypothetical protein DFP93_101267 [Aneurinibacillus soli]|uniref:Uncharacterized protein n=1 Tax=Aneurinibacillus soli TaxID=1500254 RepID=A0A0U5BJ27_9BACL|nr:hypothetical protein [Aneurinibacillus soli]PYE64241.1 hypothetical protein DFP93_101267 [Aneurinibacillus soli]BAU28190.1 hypothetical protein CB4_02364 [Aneurinibacillus soli]